MALPNSSLPVPVPPVIGLAAMFRHFERTANATERSVMEMALLHWSHEYPEADPEEELVIAKSFLNALGNYYLNWGDHGQAAG